MVRRILELFFADKSALATEGRTRTSRDCFAVRCRDPSLRETPGPFGQSLARRTKAEFWFRSSSPHIPRNDHRRTTNFPLSACDAGGGKPLTRLFPPHKERCYVDWSRTPAKHFLET